jgi:hypothetical protein
MGLYVPKGKKYLLWNEREQLLDGTAAIVLVLGIARPLDTFSKEAALEEAQLSPRWASFLDDAVGTAAIVAGLSIRRGKPFPEQPAPMSQLLRSPAQTPLEPGFFLYTMPRRGTPALTSG